MTLSGPALDRRFHELTAFLSEQLALWRPRPMRRLPLPWEDAQPRLAAFLRALPLEAVEKAEGEPFPELPGAPPPYPELARRGRALCELGFFSAAEHHQPGPRPAKIKARKWRQITAFTAAAGPALIQSQGPLLDWCGGKAHLGRLLASAQRRPLILVEREPSLCLAARRLALDEDGLVFEAAEADAFASPARAALARAGAAVALHACGALGAELLLRGAEAGLAAMALAPCCHHRILGAELRPRSRSGRRAFTEGAPLTRDDLRLATTEFVPGRPATLARRRRWMERRIGFDILARQATDATETLAVPHFPPAWVKQPFAEFCARLSAHSGRAIPAAFDEARTLAAAAERAREVRALALPRLLFRRPLELWLQLDRALALEEKSYAAELGRFCPRAVSPRDLLLIARRA